MGTSRKQASGANLDGTVRFMGFIRVPEDHAKGVEEWSSVQDSAPRASVAEEVVRLKYYGLARGAS